MLGKHGIPAPIRALRERGVVDDRESPRNWRRDAIFFALGALVGAIIAHCYWLMRLLECAPYLHDRR